MSIIIDVKIKLARLEELVKLQIEQALIKWVGEKIDAEGVKRKPKVYYRRGRWE